MGSFDLDSVQSERLRALDDLPSRRAQALSRIFVGEKVLKTIDEPKLFLDGFRLSKILPALPFSPITYVMICPKCLRSRAEIEQYLSLMRHDLIIPVLTGRYAEYPELLVDELKIRDHVSRYELNYFHDFQLHLISQGKILCPTCFDKQKNNIIEHLNGYRRKSVVRELIDDTTEMLQPPIYPDVELLNEIQSAVQERDLEKLFQLKDLDSVIRQVRWAQVWNGALALDAADLALMPKDISVELETARRTSLALREYVAQGLGVRIPLDIPIDRYAELVKEYQPRITKVIDAIVDKAGNAKSGYEVAGREISRLNNEISRIKNLNRYMALEAIAAPLRHNKALVAAGLTAGALFGLGGSLVGCAAAAAVRPAIARARKTKAVERAVEKMTKQPEMVRFARKLRSDMRPYLDGLVAKYLQAKPPAVSILAIRKGLEREERSRTVEARRHVG